jgi:ADP-ribosylglycohydrolase
MRAAPLGILPTIGEVLEKATIQAQLTHDTPDGIAAARAAALMPHYFLYDLGPKRDLGAFLEEYVPGHRWADGWQAKVGAKGWVSVRAAVGAVTAHDRLSDILRAAVAYTGDVDTVATIALAAASCSREVEQDLPGHLVDTLENGPYGRDYLIELDGRLLARTEGRARP